MNRRFLPIFVLLSMLVLVPAVSALGITPASKLIYGAGDSEEYEKSFNVVNTRDEAIGLKVDVEGVLNGSVEVLKSPNVIEPGQTGEIVYLFRPPLSEDLNPGSHIGKIMVTEMPLPGFETIAANVRIGHKVEYFIPYPGKYVEGDLTISGDDEETKFLVKASNFGEKDIDAYTNLVQIYDDGEKILELSQRSANSGLYEVVMSFAPYATGSSSSYGKLPFYKVPLPKNGYFESLYTLTNKNVRNGEYTANAVFSYDGLLSDVSRDFKIGDVDIELLSHTRVLEVNDTRRLDVRLKNQWNKNVENVRIEAELYDPFVSRKITSFNFVLEPWEETIIPLFIDTTGLAVKEYDVKFKIFFEGKEKEAEGKVRVIEIQPFLTPIGYTTIILLIVIIALLIFFVYKQRKDKEKN